MKSHLLAPLACVLLLLGCGQNKQETETTDPFLWLEELESEQSLDWVKNRNKESEKALASLPLYDSLKVQLLETFDDPDQIAYPIIVGDYVYNLWQDANNERGVWRRMKMADYVNQQQNWEVVLDLDELSEKEGKKWVFKEAEWLAPQNKRCLISLSDGGTDKSEIREFDAVSKTFVEDGFYLEASKGGAGWIDENTLLIARDFGQGSLTTSGYPRIVKKWKRNTDFNDATKVFEADSLVAGVWPYAFYSGGKQYIMIYTWVSAFETEVRYLLDGQFQKIDYPEDAQVEGMYKNQFIVALQSDWPIDETTYEKGSLVSFGLDEFMKGEKKLNVLFKPDAKSSYVSLNTSKDFVVVNSMQNVQNKLSKYQMIDGVWSETSLDVPEFSSIFLVSSDDSSNDFFYRYSNLVTPTSLVYAGDNGQKVIKNVKPAFDAEGLVVEQYEATSKDGTIVPYFIVHKEDMKLDSKNPTLVYAYGGFNASQQPYYSSVRGIGWMEQGGVYVLANIRGGGEFGPSWHQDAMKEKRQNAYDDFFSVAEDLVQRKITSPQYLGAFGWSNGGLLAGVTLTQRPDLYNAVVVGAPLLDMKRYAQMLAGASWMGEYGDPSNPDDWAYLKKYSPYHNVDKDKEYPEALFVTSIKDDRVHPGHARKMAAKMMDMGHTLYYHETIEGGHGAASTNAQEAEMWSLIFTYLNWKLNPSVN